MRNLSSVPYHLSSDPAQFKGEKLHSALIPAGISLLWKHITEAWRGRLTYRYMFNASIEYYLLTFQLHSSVFPYWANNSLQGPCHRREEEEVWKVSFQHTLSNQRSQCTCTSSLITLRLQNKTPQTGTFLWAWVHSLALQPGIVACCFQWKANIWS